MNQVKCDICNAPIDYRDFKSGNASFTYVPPNIKTLSHFHTGCVKQMFLETEVVKCVDREK